MTREIVQMVVLLAILMLLVVPVGRYFVTIFSGERHVLPERLTYLTLRHRSL